MAGVSLYEHQVEALHRMRNGCILCGDVGSGKSRTAIAYYYFCHGGEINTDEYVRMKLKPKDLYIITTARKRDVLEWDGELGPFLLSREPAGNLYKNQIVIDSWNNIKKYADVKDAFFILDEQRVVGNGVWVKSFLKIAKNNQWVLLSATPGDTWTDYIPVFLANGFFKNRTEFIREHIVYNNRVKFPQIDRYINTERLTRLRDRVLIDMAFERKTISHHEDVYAKYNIPLYKEVGRTRWDPFKNEPIASAGGLCYVWRKIVNTDLTRQLATMELFQKHSRVIIFYNYDYELAILKTLNYGTNVNVAEWNGHKHQPLPNGEQWVYLVQYNAGCEGWNCIKTDCIIFYSQNYSYKVMKQAAGRIDRLNTPYTDLYYYHLKSRSGIDAAISRALANKKNFNETRFINKKAPSIGPTQMCYTRKLHVV